MRSNPVATAVGLATVLIFGFASRRHNRKRIASLEALATQRRGETICEFAREFNSRQIDTWIIRAVFEQLQHYLAGEASNFPVRADDQLVGLLIADPDDLDMDIVEEIANRTGRSLGQLERNPHCGQVHTVRDLVQFFNAQPLQNAI